MTDDPKTPETISPMARFGIGLVRFTGLIGLGFCFLMVLMTISTNSEEDTAVIQFSHGHVPTEGIKASIVPALEAARKGQITLRIVGHTKPDGDRLENLRLGWARAVRVAQALNRFRVPDESIIWESAGGEDPLGCTVSESQTACDVRHARAEIIVMGKVSVWAEFFELVLGGLGGFFVVWLALSRKAQKTVTWDIKALGAGFCSGGVGAAMMSAGEHGAIGVLMAGMTYLSTRGALFRVDSPGPSEEPEVAETPKTEGPADPARRLVERIKAADERIANRELSAALAALYGKGLRIVELLEAQPELIQRSDRFVNVYLEGAVGVSEKYADLHRDTNAGNLDDSFRAFLDRMIRTFDQQREALLADDVLDLDLEIEVLRKRMQTEGL